MTSTPRSLRKKVEKHFGEIPAGPPVARHQHWVPRVTGTRRQKLADRVPQARIHKVWAVPAYGEAENVYLQLLPNGLKLVLAEHHATPLVNVTLQN